MRRDDTEKPIRAMTEPELSLLMRQVARVVESVLPPGALFAVVATDPIDPVVQYVANCERMGVILMIRELADRLERRQTTERTGFEPGEN